MQKRNTIQRQLVISAVRSLSNHPTAEEVYNRIVLDYPDISKGTVYRNLNSLVDSGLLHRVSVPSSADRYDHMLTKHYHVQCVKCHRFMNVDDLDYFQDLDDKIAQMTGYRTVWKTIISCSRESARNARLKNWKRKNGKWSRPKQKAGNLIKSAKNYNPVIMM